MSRSHRFPLASAACAALALSIFVWSCASPGAQGIKTVTAASAEQRASTFDRVKALQGTWEAADPSGVKFVASVFSVSSDGSVVREIMLPGTPHEMTNMYHMDGPSLVCTHYCAMGNQPHLRATAVEQTKIHFTLESVSNMTSSDGDYMGDLVMEWIDKDHLRCHWKGFHSGKATDESVFDLARKA